jgi:beta-ureidopropionase / N-carbamoyl-L-amino-acid hydrolase
MEHPLDHLRIHEARLRADFEALGQIGATPEGGVSRPALSPADLEGRAWLGGRIAAAGLELRLDGAGNLGARLNCGPAGAPSLLMGSHMDSVPGGGRYDGALGVLAGLEVLRTVQDAGLRLPAALEAVDFTDEEGALVGFLGSSAFSGQLTPDQLAAPRGPAADLAAGLGRAGLTPAGILGARRDPRSLAGYLELHIEQGSRLEQAGVQIGVVTGINGLAYYRLAFLGRADHAGSTPLEIRRDAAWGASAFILSLRELVMGQFPGCFANVGAARFEPGAFNIVPRRATLSVEFRASNPPQLEQLKAAVLDLAASQAGRFGLELEVEFVGQRAAVQTDPVFQAAIQAAAEELGLSTQPLASHAGHDAQLIAALCPVGMIFVPSQGGTSHAAAEFTRWEDCVNGANVLLQSALRLAG